MLGGGARGGCPPEDLGRIGAIRTFRISVPAFSAAIPQSKADARYSGREISVPKIIGDRFTGIIFWVPKLGLPTSG
jgi:hypothetical protein